MRIQENDKLTTIFYTRYSYFKYQVIFLDLFNAPASFQKYSNKIFAKKLHIFVVIYFNIILMFIEDSG